MKLLLFMLVLTQARRENIEWCDAWLPHMKDSSLPRVILIGDSITRGYYAGVETALKERAYVARIATSKAVGDPALAEELGVFLKQAKFDVVHFNIGMHGWDYTEAEYEKHFPDLVKAIRKAVPRARLVWASTTPVRKDREGGATNARILKRNEIAASYCAKAGIPIDDLHGLMLPHGGTHSDDVHFNKDGNALMSKQVAEAVNRLL